MIKTIIIILTFFLSMSVLADEEMLTSGDLLIAKQWLSKNGGEHWNLFYNEMDGKKYQWIITKRISNDEVFVSFKAGNEIDKNGKMIIGGLGLKWSDQFFILVIDRKTYKLKHVSLGG